MAGKLRALFTTDTRSFRGKAEAKQTRECEPFKLYDKILANKEYKKRMKEMASRLKPLKGASK